MKPSVEKGKKPEWLKKRLPPGGRITRLERLISGYGLNTVCRGAKCPNRNECFHKGTATFLVLGNICTRSCRFCSIAGGAPVPPDAEEPGRIAEAVARMGLRFAVITSVTRDDLPDGGASHFVEVIRLLKKRVPGIGVEVLIPDFSGNEAAVDAVLGAGPTVLNHNLETVPSLYPRVRPGALFDRSLALLRRAAEHGGAPAKSGLMLGLGERLEEVEAVLEALAAAGVRMVTLGQYLQPGPQCIEVAEYVAPERFEQYARTAYRMGFSGVASGPFVRSSHEAGELYKGFLEKGNGS